MTLQNTRAAVALIVAAALPLSSSLAQSRADSLLNAGALQRAESLYYAGVQARPRDPVARWALGRYLVSRGAPRVGATLFEEALQFGGDASLVGADLAPVYLSLGEYHKLSALKTSPLSTAERERARWLVAHDTKLTAPDSTTALPYKKSNDGSSIGRMTIRVNGRSIEATITPRARGIVVSDTTAVAKRLRAFRTPSGARGGASIPAVADSIGIGRFSIADYPVSIRSLSGNQQALIGLDMLARFAPTFDPRGEHVTLHASGSVPKPAVGVDQFSTLLLPDDLRVLRAGGWLSIDQAQISQMLTTRRWTFDAKRGQLSIER